MKTRIIYLPITVIIFLVSVCSIIAEIKWLEGTRDASTLEEENTTNFAPDYIKSIKEFGKLEDKLKLASEEKKPIIFYYFFSTG